MDRNDYLLKHIPHRLNLLITYRERFKGLSDNQTEAIRDLYRCAKDISMMMVRLLLGEMGVNLPKDVRNVEDLKENNSEPINNKIVKALKKQDILNHQHKSEIFEVLVAANRAVAHTNHVYIDHKVDKNKLIKAIDFVEDCIKKNIYDYNAEDLPAIMKLPENNMQRSLLNLSQIL